MAAHAAHGGSITVSAAASLKDVLNALGSTFEHENPGTKIRFNMGSSGELMVQIAAGAPADIFIAASPREVAQLQKKGLIEPGSVFQLAGNSVVLISPANSSKVHSFNDLLRPDVIRIAIGNPKTVPAGRYALEVLHKLGLYDRLKYKYIYSEDVRQALNYASTGEVDAAIVYGTDAAIAGQSVRIAAVAPASSHKPVVYPAAVVKGSRNLKLARAFMAFLRSPRAAVILKRYGFTKGK
ncbi:MAG: molybdate ABC transporter substrate-binding protein [Actinomycetota bacterium]|nr:molybdate ABC transporter substrate-binding protein [Actinomycetota bacterium]